MNKFFQNKNFSENKVRNLLIGLYILIVLGFSASAKAESHVFEGEITQTVDGSSYLVISDREYYEIVSNDIDFELFSGNFVRVTAELVKLTAGPVFTIQSSMNFDSIETPRASLENTPVLHVLGISAIAE